MDFSRKSPSGLFVFTGIIVGVLLFFPGISRGEETQTPANSKLPKIVTPQIPGEPLIVYLIDVHGKLSPAIVNFPFEAFDALKLLSDQKSDEPLYQIQNIDAVGKVVDDLAEMTIRFRVDTKNSPLIRVPLGFHDGIIVLPDNQENHKTELDIFQFAQYEGPGHFRLTRDQEKGEYVALIQNGVTISNKDAAASSNKSSILDKDGDSSKDGTSGKDRVLESSTPLQNVTHTITLKLSFPVISVGNDEFRLKASFPRAVSSIFKLEVPLPDANATVSQGTTPVQTVALDEKVTQFSVQGLHSDFDIRWRASHQKKVEFKSVLKVEDALIHVDLTGNEAKFDVTIPVQSTTGPVDVFHVLLPENATWTHETVSEYSIRELDPLSDVEGCRKLEVTLPEKTEDKIAIRFKAVIAAPNRESDWFEVGGFQVPEAEKQFGKIEIVIPNEYRLNKQGLKGIRASTEYTIVPDINGTVNSFEFFLQPWTLQVKASKRYTKINVRPEYQIQIEKNQAILKGRLSYTINGSPIDHLLIDPADWNADWRSFETPTNNNLVDTERITYSSEGQIQIPLRIPIDKSIDFEFSARLAINPQNPVVRFSFPKLKADWVEPAIVSIFSADNIELNANPNIAPMAGMSKKSRKSVQPRIEAPVRQQEPLIYQLDDMEGAVFTAELVSHAQHITVESLAELRLFAENESQTYSLNYRVNYEPVSFVTIAVPKELEEKGQWQFTLDNQPLTTTVVNDVSQQVTLPPSLSSLSSDVEGTIFRRIFLPEDKIGNFTLIAQLSPTDTGKTNIPSGRTFYKNLPLLLPVEGTFVQESVTVRVPRGVQIHLVDDEMKTSWKKVGQETSVSARLISFQFRAGKAEPVLPISRFLDDHNSFGSTVVEKSWLQTWLVSNHRMDRAVYLMTSDASQLNVTLPKQTQPDSITVKINSQSYPVTVEDNQLRLVFPVNYSSKTPVLVELWYEVSIPTSGNHVVLEIPHFGPEVWIRPTYWQIILPLNRHLTSMSRSWIPQYHWEFKGFYLARTPQIDMPWFEDWIGHGVTSSPPLSEAVNSYLFNSLEPVTVGEIHVIDRSTLVLFSSGSVLLVGLLFLYFRKIRYMGIIFALLILSISALFYQPVLALLFLQAGSIGVVLSLLALILHRLFAAKETWNDIFLTEMTAYSHSVSHSASGSHSSGSRQNFARETPPESSEAISTKESNRTAEQEEKAEQEENLS